MTVSLFREETQAHFKIQGNKKRKFPFEDNKNSSYDTTRAWSSPSIGSWCSLFLYSGQCIAKVTLKRGVKVWALLFLPWHAISIRTFEMMFKKLGAKHVLAPYWTTIILHAFMSIIVGVQTSVNLHTREMRQDIV